MASLESDKQQINSSIITSCSVRPKLEFSKLISWSKNGFIAFSPPDYNSKNNLLLTYLENIDGNSWQLAKSQSINIKLENNFLPKLSLVSWSNLSTDLAISDIYGNFYILLAGVGLLESDNKENKINNGTSASSPSYELTSYNHMEMIYRDVIRSQPTNQSASTSFVISFKWLNIEKPQIINKPAVYVNVDQHQSQSNSSLTYTYGVNQYHLQTVTHPISTKQACVALRQNGEFILYYQGEHKVEYHKTSVNLSEESIYITHASIGFFNQRTIVIAAYDLISNIITTYSVEVDWGFLVESAKKQIVDPHYHTPKESQKLPKLTLTKVYEMSPFPIYIDDFSENEDQMEIGDDSNKASQTLLGKLSSIDIVSPFHEKESKLNILISYESEDEHSSVSTTIYRYELVDHLELISDAFTDLGLRKNISVQSEGQTKDFKLLLLDKLKRAGKVQSIETSITESIILVIYTNGTIDAIDRTSMKIVNNRSEENNNNPPPYISNIFDAGFEFPRLEVESPLLLAVSPNFTSIVYTAINNESQNLIIKVVEKKRELGVSPKELFITSVGFAFCHSYACYTNTYTDDLIVLIQTEIKRIVESLNKTTNNKVDLVVNKFVESILCESHKAINFQLDAFSKESVDKLLSNPPLQKLLSLQLVLGEIVDRKHIISDIAWVVLNLRSTSFGIMFSLSSIYRQISKKKPADDTLQDSITRGECIISLIGNVKWLIDLMVYLNQELLQLSYSKNDCSSSKLTVDNSIALPIILSKVPRLFLMYALSSIGKTHEILKKLHKDLSECNKVFTPMKEALNRYFTICNLSPLNLKLFENFLRECDAFINKELGAKLAHKDKGYSLKVEQKLVCQGELTKEMVQVANILIERHAMNINRDIKVSELYFYDVDWIDIGINKHSSNNIPFDSDIIICHYPNLKDSIVPRLRYSETECIDALRKIVITVDNRLCSKRQIIASSQISKLRKCTRCRSVSLVSDPFVFDAVNTLGLWTMVFQRTCICGNAWVNCEK